MLYLTLNLSCDNRSIFGSLLNVELLVKITLFNNISPDIVEYVSFRPTILNNILFGNIDFGRQFWILYYIFFLKLMVEEIWTYINLPFIEMYLSGRVCNRDFDIFICIRSGLNRVTVCILIFKYLRSMNCHCLMTFDVLIDKQRYNIWFMLIAVFLECALFLHKHTQFSDFLCLLMIT